MTPLSDLSTDLPSPRLKIEEPLQFSIGAVSPLWMLFAGAAATGAAYWWMTRWARPVNLEAILGETAQAAFPEPEPRSFEAAPEPAPVAEAFEPPIGPVIDPEPEPVAQAVTEQAEASPEPAASKPAPKPKAARAPLPPEA